MRLNPTNKLFKMDVNSEIYVDKSMLISFTNKCINTNNRYIYVSRPRRFGKTVNINMLSAYYSKGCSSIDIFNNLNISKDASFKKHLNKYNVIFINILDYLYKCNNVLLMVKSLSDDIKNSLLNNFNLSDYNYTDIVDLLQYLSDNYNEEFIFLIDEWDSLIRNKNISNDDLKIYLDFMRYLLKDRDFIALVYMTGIFPIKKYGGHSELNMFNEYTMLNSKPVSEYIGFTENEIDSLCTSFNVNQFDIRKWYNGYTIDGYNIYNPRSTVQAILNNNVYSYWTTTETYESLKQYIQQDIFDMRLIITDLIHEKNVKFNPNIFQNDLHNINSSDDIITLLIHLGYLTYNNGYARIPNLEIKNQFIETLKNIKWNSVLSSIERSKKLINATLDKNTELVNSLIEEIHNENTSIIQYNNENSLSCTIALAYYAIQDTHFIFRELPAGKGFADLVFVPKNNVNMPAIIVELKYNKSAKTAITQIRNKKYVECLSTYNGKVLLVGINYDSKTKNHESTIEEVML